MGALREMWSDLCKFAIAVTMSALACAAFLAASVALGWPIYAHNLVGLDGTIAAIFQVGWIATLFVAGWVASAVRRARDKMKREAGS